MIDLTTCSYYQNELNRIMEIFTLIISTIIEILGKPTF